MLSPSSSTIYLAENWADNLLPAQVRLIGFVGGQGPEVRKVGDQTVAQVSLGIRPKSGNTNELSWVVCDFWNHEVRVLFTSLLYQRCHLCHFTSILCSRHTGGRCYPCSWLTRQSLKSSVMQAMQVAQHVRKGMQLAIGGHLKQSKWLDRTTGMQREALRVRTAPSSLSQTPVL